MSDPELSGAPGAGDRVSALLNLLARIFDDALGYSADARAKAVWHRENFSAFLTGHDELVRPVTAEFWPSLSCPARCALCPYRRNGARREADRSEGLELADLATVHRVAEQLAGFGVSSVLLTGGGEPLMHPNLGEIAETFSRAGLAFGLYSNGAVPGREAQLTQVLRLRPAFVRLSVNAGSAGERARVYHLPPVDGRSSWELLIENSLFLLAELARLGLELPLTFSWVLQGTEPPSTYRGAGAFLRLLWERSGGRPIAAHFRPKLLYYAAPGVPAAALPSSWLAGIARIPQSVDAFVRPAVAGCADLAVQCNRHGIDAVARGGSPGPCFASGWQTSINHRGEAFILSELAGSPWEGARWADLVTEDLATAWSGPTRTGLHREYAGGLRLAPLHHKLLGLQDALQELRGVLGGALSAEELERFWLAFDHSDFRRPTTWNFI